jgi:hypothetical protein
MQMLPSDHSEENPNPGNGRLNFSHRTSCASPHLHNLPSKRWSAFWDLDPASPFQRQFSSPVPKGIFIFTDELIEVPFTMFEVEPELSSSIVFQVLKKMSLRKALISLFHGSRKLSFST